MAAPTAATLIASRMRRPSSEANPEPSAAIGHISGETNIAPTTTATEFLQQAKRGNTR